MVHTPPHYAHHRTTTATTRFSTAANDAPAFSTAANGKAAYNAAAGNETTCDKTTRNAAAYGKATGTTGVCTIKPKSLAKQLASDFGILICFCQ